MPVIPDQPDGYSTFQGGMNEGVASGLLPDYQTKKNINITLRDNVISPRPVFDELDLEFETDPDDKPYSCGATYRNILRYGRLQHVGKFQLESGEYIVAVINGVIFLINEKTLKVRVVKVDARFSSLNYYATRLNGSQANRYYVIFDWPNQPVYIDQNLDAKRTTSRNEEIPRSYLGAFVHNRLFVANKGIEFGASDPVSPNYPLAPITFKESIVSDTNPSPAYPDQFFSLSYIDKLSAITAMGYLQQTDGTSPLGFGPLFVSTKEALHLFAVSNPRERWDEIQFGSAYIFNYGIVGPQAFTNVGPDLFYRSFDGHVYSTSTLFGDQRKWGHTHISREIESSLLTANKSLLKYSFLTYLDNRLFVSLQPYIVKAELNCGLVVEDYVFNGLGVLEFNNVSGLTANAGAPVWASVYPGAFSHGLEVNGNLIFTGKTNLNTRPRNVFYRLNQVSTQDSVKQGRYPVKSRFYTREFEFEQPVLHKKLQHVYLDFREILGPIQVEVSYKTNNDSAWKTFGKIYKNTDVTDKRYSISSEFLSKDVQDSEFIRIQFRVDIIGLDYELLRMFILADITQQVEPRRKLDPSDRDAFIEGGFLKDGELCLL